MNRFDKVIYAACLLFQKAKHTIRPQKRIHLIGDSLMASQPWYKYPVTGWGTHLHVYLNSDKVSVINHARNGGSTMSFSGQNYFSRALKSVKENDIVIIGFAHNDAYFEPLQGESLLTIYESLLRAFIYELKNKKAIIILSTPIVRYNLTPDHGDFPETICRIATKEAILLFDLHGISKNLQLQLGQEKSKELYLMAEPGRYIMHPKGAENIIHLSPYGAHVFAKHAADTINPFL